MSIRIKILIFLFALMLLATGSIHYLMERNATRAMLEREQVSASNILKVILGDISHYYHDILTYKLTSLVRRREMMKEAVKLSIEHIRSLRELALEGVIDEDRAKAEALDWLRSHDFGQGGRFIAFDENLLGLAHPNPEWEGRRWEGFMNLKGRDALKEAIEDVKIPGDDFTVMQWNEPRAEPRADQLAFFDAFEPWGWVVGATQCLDSIEREVDEKKASFFDHLQGFFDTISLDMHGVVAVYDGQGALLVDSSPSGKGPARELLGELPREMRLFLDAANRQDMLRLAPGGPEYAVFKDYYKPLAWHVCYLVPVDALMRPIKNLTSLQLRVIGIIFFASIALIYALIRRLTAPIAILSRHARSLPAEDFKASPEFLADLRGVASSSNDEFADLADSFLAMQTRLDRYIEELTDAASANEAYAQQLQAANETLENNVAERTSELHQTNLRLQAEIEERAAASRALRESNEQLRGIFEYAPMLISIKDLFGRFTLVNRQFELVFNLPHEMAVGRSPRDFFGDEADLSEIHDRNVIATGEPMTIEERFSVAGHSNMFLTTIFPLFHEHGLVHGVCSISQNITELKELEAEAIRAAHLASIGELAASIAHEINNPINGIINYSQVILDRSGDDPLTADVSRRIIKEGGRIAHIVRSLLSYARAETSSPGPVDLRVVLDEVLTLAALQMNKHGVRLETDIPPGAPPVLGQEQEIKQVFLNLISNAREALQDRFPGDSPDKLLRIFTHPPDTDAGFLRISFLDHGQGVPAEALPHICEPFYTTKPPSKGTGLGLSISSQIIRKHGGTLRVASVYGEYTQVDVDLPLYSAKAAVKG